MKSDVGSGILVGVPGPGRSARARTALTAAVCVMLSVSAVVDVLAQAEPAPPSFEIASIKPNIDRGGAFVPPSCRGTDGNSEPSVQTPMGYCLLTDAVLVELIRMAYESELAPGLPPNELITGGPRWSRTDRFNVTAKAADPSTTTVQQLRQMLQTLLADRFGLRFHRETKDAPGYALVVAKNGPRLQAAKGDENPSIVGGSPQSALRETIARNASMTALAASLTNLGIGPVVDRTDLRGRYDFRLTFERDAGTRGKGEPVPVESRGGSGPALVTALEEQLGLRLISQKVRVEYLVIDSAVRPGPD